MELVVGRGYLLIAGKLYFLKLIDFLQIKLECYKANSFIENTILLLQADLFIAYFLLL
jgi:hypothetical protein